MPAAPDSRGASLAPITYAAAFALYQEGGRRPFSFVAAPYGVPKTITVERGNVVASPPEAAMQQYRLRALRAPWRSHR